MCDHSIRFAYDNGCCLCDAQNSIRAYLSDDDTGCPPWFTSEECLIQDIASIMRLCGYPTREEYDAMMAEIYGSPTHEWPS